MSNDMYLPSVKEYIKRRICNLRKIFSPDAAAIKRHRKGDSCTKRQGDDDEDINGDDEEDKKIAIETVVDDRASVSNLLEIFSRQIIEFNEFTFIHTLVLDVHSTNLTYFQANVRFLEPLKTSKNLWFSDVFRS